MGVRTENEIVTDLSLTWLKTSIEADWWNTDWVGVPDIIPEVRLRESPIGRDPSMIEKESWSPLIVGMIENDSSFDRIYEDEE